MGASHLVKNSGSAVNGKRSVRPTGKFLEKVELLKRFSRFPGGNVPTGFSRCNREC